MQKTFQIIFIVLTMNFCTPNKSVDRPKYTLPSDHEINEVVKTIIESDTAIISEKDRRLAYFSIDLQKYNVRLPSKCDSCIDLNFYYDIAISQLLYESVLKKPYFSKTDSLYFLYQNDSLKSAELNAKLFSNYKLLPIKEINKRFKTDDRFAYYQFSIPYFSLDRTKAHVEFSFVCGSLCGQSGIFLLQKVNSKWVIVSTDIVSIS
jgi:hypothetical protein